MNLHVYNELLVVVSFLISDTNTGCGYDYALDECPLTDLIPVCLRA